MVGIHRVCVESILIVTVLYFFISFLLSSINGAVTARSFYLHLNKVIIILKFVDGG